MASMQEQEVQTTPETPSWQFTTDEGSAQTAAPVASVSWTASEYIAHARGFRWFMAFGLVLAAGIIAVFALTRDILATVAIALAGFIFAVFAVRPPRTLTYTLDEHGIQIDNKRFLYAELKSFAVIYDSPLPSVLLLPLKRFLPPITVFYDPKEEDAIIDTLAAYLPHEEHEPDFVDRLMARIRF